MYISKSFEMTLYSKRHHHAQPSQKLEDQTLFSVKLLRRPVEASRIQPHDNNMTLGALQGHISVDIRPLTPNICSLNVQSPRTPPIPHLIRLLLRLSKSLEYASRFQY